jgi:lipid-A-disaccharide synthase
MVRGEGPTIYVGKTPELIEAATCCLAVSGSVSLELLHHAKPTVILYHVSSFAYWLQSLFRRVPYITLVNLLTAPELFPEKVGVYDRRDAKDAHVLMPEYLTYQDKSDDLAYHAVQWLNSKEDRTELVERMTVLKNKVAVAGASERAAEYVLRELGLSTGDVQGHAEAA